MNGPARAGLCALLLALCACGTLQISVEGAATPDRAATDTVSALQAKNAELQTQVALLGSRSDEAATRIASTTPATFGAAPTPAPPSATRITFLNGATVGVVNAPIAAGTTQSFVLQVFQAQPMFVFVGSPGSDVTLSINRQDGTPILREEAHQISWQGTLPQTENYYLTIHGGTTTEEYSLTVTVPSRIEFGQGANTASISGKTVAGYDVSYTVMAAKRQKLSVQLDNVSAPASLSIYGFTDGQRYLSSSSSQASYGFVLPATQDYIIVVVPRAGRVVSYTLTVTIQ
ncbi:MAG TPA: hypothetical protein VF784_08000 [Anaerolineales bacterium]